MSFSSFKGVSPAACTSPTRGSEIFPSERTGIEREMSGSFQTLMASTSSLPITKLSSCGLSDEVAGDVADDVAGELAGDVCAPAAPASSTPSSKTTVRKIVLCAKVILPRLSYFRVPCFPVAVAVTVTLALAVRRFVSRFVPGEFSGGNRRKILLRSSHFILLDLVQHGPVADLEHTRRRLAVPAGAEQRGRDGIALGFPLDALDQRLQRFWRGFRGLFRAAFQPSGSGFQPLRGRIFVRIHSAHRVHSVLAADRLGLARNQIALHERF